MVAPKLTQLCGFPPLGFGGCSLESLVEVFGFTLTKASLQELVMFQEGGGASVGPTTSFLPLLVLITFKSCTC